MELWILDAASAFFKERMICLLARFTRAAVLLDVLGRVLWIPEEKIGKFINFTDGSSSEISLNHNQQRLTRVVGTGAPTLHT